jgi:hypothetical protein
MSPVRYRYREERWDRPCLLLRGRERGRALATRSPLRGVAGQFGLLAAAPLVAQGPPIQCHHIEERIEHCFAHAAQTAAGNLPNYVTLGKYSQQLGSL